jgi:hypothetical protein
MGGAVRNTFPGLVPVSSGKVVALGVIWAGEGVGAPTVAHELVHRLQSLTGGSYELYGNQRVRGYCLNGLFTVLGCTTAGFDDRRTWHLDPLTKLRFGWLEPQVFEVDANACLTLPAAENGEPGAAAILYDPARGTSEYFLVEYREPALDGGFNYDGDRFGRGSLSLPDRGLGLWYVKLDSSGLPVKISHPDGTGARDRAVLLVPPGSDREPTDWGKVWRDGLWDVSDGAASPTWIDGSETGLALRVVRGATGAKELHVELGDGSCAPPLPVILAHERELPGVDAWRHARFALRRTLPSPLPTGGNFEVSWTLESTQPQSGSISIVDYFPSSPGNDPPTDPYFTAAAPSTFGGQTVTFEDFPQPGEIEERSYGAYAGSPGGLLLTSEIEVALAGEPPETVVTSTLHAIEDPVALLPAEGDDGDGDGVADDADACPGTMSDADAGVPSRHLGRNRWVLDASQGWFTSSERESPSLALDETLGCSCAQIVDALAAMQGGNEGSLGGHRKFGCSRSLLEGWIAGDAFEEIDGALQIPAAVE